MARAWVWERGPAHRVRGGSCREAGWSVLSRPVSVTFSGTVSVTGVAEQVSAVVDKLVDRVAGRNRDGALVCADEEDHQNGDEAVEERPRGDLAEGDRGDLDLGNGGGLSHCSS